MIRPAPPLPALTTIFSGLSFGHVDVGQEMRDIRLQCVDADAARRARAGAGKLAALGEAADLLQPLSPLMGLDCSRTNFMPL